MKRSLLLMLMAIAGTAILAVTLVGFRLSQGGLDYSAFAHIYDISGNTTIGTEDVHLEIDLVQDAGKSTPSDYSDDVWCDDADATSQVTVGDEYRVAVCLTSNAKAPAALNFDLLYNDLLNQCPETDCTSGTCIDENPDLNDGTKYQSTPDLGVNWDCGNSETQPVCDKNTTETGAGKGVASMNCTSTSTPTLPIGANASSPLAAVTFRAIKGGADSMTLDIVGIYDEDGGRIMRCIGSGPCYGATEQKNTPQPATATFTPTATNTPVPPTPTFTPPAGVRMEKDANVLKEGVQTVNNLWLMAEGCVVPEQGKGCLVIDKKVFAYSDADSPNDDDDGDGIFTYPADLDEKPEGLGAWEEQIKYQHKIVNITPVPAYTWIVSGGREAYCTMTVLTENWVLTGCVTKDPPGVPGIQLGPQGSGLIERIYVIPLTDDLIYRDGFRPTKDNGVVTDIVDENCEVADIYAEYEVPPLLPGGLTTVCGDAYITVRMLEGDLNLDCQVTVADDQAIAFRYGSFFGLQLYDQWFDLEPKWSDFDIDIKDLQFVFGRNYSTCQAPIPNDQAVPVPPPQP